jgi:hypothetical protein
MGVVAGVAGRHTAGDERGDDSHGLPDGRRRPQGAGSPKTTRGRSGTPPAHRDQVRDHCGGRPAPRSRPGNSWGCWSPEPQPGFLSPSGGSARLRACRPRCFPARSAKATAGRGQSDGCGRSRRQPRAATGPPPHPGRVEIRWRRSADPGAARCRWFPGEWPVPAEARRRGRPHLPY